MNLTISPQAQMLIAEQGNIISVKIDKKITFGWGGPRVRTNPSVWREKPQENELPEYKELKLSGVTVYAHQSLEGFGQLEVAVESSFTGRKLVLRGLSEKKDDCCG